MGKTKARGHLFVAFFCIFMIFQVTSQNTPKFIKKSSNPILGFTGEALNFTWIYSNHSCRRIYFGIWNKNFGVIDPSLLVVNIFANSSISLHPNTAEFSAKPYVNRVRWVGDITHQEASFELSYIRDSDKNNYGIEVDFHDTYFDVISAWSNLIVKPSSVFTFGPDNISSGNGGTANFTWKYSLIDIDVNNLTSIKFGVYKNEQYMELCDIKVHRGMATTSDCSPSRGKAHISDLDADSRVVFVLRNVNLQDEAVYSIILGGLRRPMEGKTKLFVTDPPKITTQPQSKTVNEGQKFNLTCFTSGKPEPTITWYKNGRIIKEHSNGIFLVNKTKKTDDGTYGCIAKNSVGEDRSYTARVQVYYAPRINLSRSTMNVHVQIGEGRTLRCPAIANPKATHRWIIDGVVDHSKVSESIDVTVTSEKDYKKYTCIVVNEIGQDNTTFALKHVAVPDSPKLITASATEVSITVNWNKPDGHGYPVLMYSVHRIELGEGEQEVTYHVNEDVHDYEIGDVEGGKSYKFYVTAWNTHGESVKDDSKSISIKLQTT